MHPADCPTECIRVGPFSTSSPLGLVQFVRILARLGPLCEVQQGFALGEASNRECGRSMSARRLAALAMQASRVVFCSRGLAIHRVSCADLKFDVMPRCGKSSILRIPAIIFSCSSQSPERAPGTSRYVTTRDETGVFQVIAPGANESWFGMWFPVLVGCPKGLARSVDGPLGDWMSIRQGAYHDSAGKLSGAGRLEWPCLAILHTANNYVCGACAWPSAVMLVEA